MPFSCGNIKNHCSQLVVSRGLSQVFVFLTFGGSINKKWTTKEAFKSLAVEFGVANYKELRVASVLKVSLLSSVVTQARQAPARALPRFCGSLTPSSLRPSEFTQRRPKYD